jgi:hypothetical protein
MNRFLAFVGDEYYPGRHLGDFFGDFAAADDAIREMQPAIADPLKWACILDTETGNILVRYDGFEWEPEWTPLERLG